MKPIEKPGDVESGKIIYPINCDYVFSAKVVSYTESKAEVQLNAIWDQAETPKVFYAKAVYMGALGTPRSAEVVADSIVPVARVGRLNRQAPVAGYGDPAIVDDESTTATDFLAFFFPF